MDDIIVGGGDWGGDRGGDWRTGGGGRGGASRQLEPLRQASAPRWDQTLHGGGSGGSRGRGSINPPLESMLLHAAVDCVGLARASVVLPLETDIYKMIKN